MKSKKEIILIEDDKAIIDVYKIAMEAEGINLKVIEWGKEAIKEIEEIQSGKKEKPSLILLDLMLPDMNGIDILKKIKGISEFSDVAVFILSNYTSPDLANLGTSAPDKVILKTNISPIDLVKLVKGYLKQG